MYYIYRSYRSTKKLTIQKLRYYSHTLDTYISMEHVWNARTCDKVNETNINLTLLSTEIKEFE